LFVKPSSVGRRQRRTVAPVSVAADETTVDDARIRPPGAPDRGMACAEGSPTVRPMQEHATPPAIGTHVLVRRSAPYETFQSGIVVGHLRDASLGCVLELRMSDSARLQRVWPSPAVRLRGSS
jgi:hypothetical protein